jgi:hypothetical protein
MILLILFLKLPKNQPLEDFPDSRLANRIIRAPVTFAANARC